PGLPPSAGSFEENGHCRRRAERESHFIGLRRVGVEPEVLESVEDHIERDRSLDTRKVRTEAEVLAVGEREVVLRFPVDVEAVRLVPPRLVVVRTPQCDRHRQLRWDLHPGELY